MHLLEVYRRNYDRLREVRPVLIVGRFGEAAPSGGEALGRWLQEGEATPSGTAIFGTCGRREQHRQRLSEVKGELVRRRLDERSRQLLEQAEAGVMGADPGAAMSGVQSTEAPAVSDADREIVEMLKSKLRDLLDANLTLGELADKVKELLAAARKGNPLLTAGTASESRLVAPVASALSAGERVQLREQRGHKQRGGDTAPSGAAALGAWLQGF